MKQIQVKPVFVQTRNVRNFQAMMDGLALAEGEGRLGLVFGRAGRGKTRTAQWHTADMAGVYLRTVTCWSTSELEFLRALARELGVIQAPHRKGPCFQVVVDRLVARPKTVFVDEIEKLSARFLDLVRDLSDISTAPFVLIGEEELLPAMRRNRRVWSRTYQQLEFEPISAADVMVYAREATGLKLTAEVCQVLLAASGGDFRIVRRDVLNLVHTVNARGSLEVDAKLASVACRMGLAGR